MQLFLFKNLTVIDYGGQISTSKIMLKLNNIIF